MDQHYAYGFSWDTIAHLGYEVIKPRCIKTVQTSGYSL